MIGRVLALAALAAAPVAAQEEGAVPDVVAVEVDCPGRVPGCDQAFFQTEIGLVRFVRDRADADVYVLVTSEQTGSRGRRTTLYVSGRRAFEGQSVVLRATTGPDATADDLRRAILGRLLVGLAGYVAQTPSADRVAVSFRAALPDSVAAAPLQAPAVRDPWDGWTFRVRASGSVRGQRVRTSLRAGGSFRAERVTDRFKVSVGPTLDYDRDTYVRGDGTTVVENVAVSGGGLAVWSLGRRTSAGVRASAFRSSFSNYALRLQARPGVEVSLFPYAEAARRGVRLRYEAGPELAVYDNTTVLGQTREVLAEHLVRGTVEYAQPWGSADLSLSGSQYLTRLDKYRLGIDGGLNVRLARGLALRLDASAVYIQDQINLPAQDASDEDVLTGQRELATSYRYATSVGLTYVFGSAFSGAVNPRFGS